MTTTKDGRWGVTGSDDNLVGVWNLRTGACLHEKGLSGHTSHIHSVSTTPDSKLILSASSDKTIRVWDIESGICLKTLKGHEDEVWGVSAAPDGQRIVSGGCDQRLRIFDLRTQACVKVLKGHRAEITSVSAAADGWRAVSGSWDRTVRIWDIQTGTCLKVLEGHTDKVRSVAITPDSRRVVSGASDGTLRVWNLETGECLHVLAGHSSQVRNVCVSPDGQFAYSVSDDQAVRVWNLNEGKCMVVAPIAEGNDIPLSIAVGPDQLMIFGFLSGDVFIPGEKETRDHSSSRRSRRKAPSNAQGAGPDKRSALKSQKRRGLTSKASPTAANARASVSLGQPTGKSEPGRQRPRDQPSVGVSNTLLSQFVDCSIHYQMKALVDRMPELRSEAFMWSFASHIGRLRPDQRHMAAFLFYELLWLRDGYPGPPLERTAAFREGGAAARKFIIFDAILMDDNLQLPEDVRSVWAAEIDGAYLSVTDPSSMRYVALHYPILLRPSVRAEIQRSLELFDGENARSEDWQRFNHLEDVVADVDGKLGAFIRKLSPKVEGA